jgi:hypothetical protein
VREKRGSDRREITEAKHRVDAQIYGHCIYLCSIEDHVDEGNYALAGSGGYSIV